MSPRSTTHFTAAEVLCLGLFAGAFLGGIGGIAECVAAPLETPWRFSFVVGWDSALGALWGLLVALVVAAFPGARPRPRNSSTAAVMTLLLFPAFTAALGLFVNKVLLSGTHFLSAKSLAADALAAVVAFVVSWGLGRRLGALNLAAPRPLVVAGVLISIVALVVVPTRVLERGANPKNLPSIVLVSIDTLRPDRLSAGGEPQHTSPEVDRLLREGMQFGQALAASPGSAASHAALFTSRYPISNGVWSNFSVMNESVLTWAEILQEEGYRTGGFATNTFLGRRFQFDQGFDTYVESGMVERLEEPSPAGMFRSLALVQIVDRLRGRLQPGYDPSFETALSWLDESDRPVFFFVHIMDVHSPYVPPHPYGPRFNAERLGNQASKKRNRFGWKPSVESYLAEIRFADYKIGRLRKALEVVNRLDDAYVILTSDHGENLVDHEPNFSHGSTLFDATLRILAGIRSPASPAGTLVWEPFENVDILPLVWRQLGWPPEEDWEGYPMGEAPEGRIAFSQLSKDFAARGEGWKYISKHSGEHEFYDLSTDPGERLPILLVEEERDRYQKLLDDWFAEVSTELYLEHARSILPGELTPEIQDKLRTLGYID